jgi:hypothetical protein
MLNKQSRHVFNIWLKREYSTKYLFAFTSKKMVIIRMQSYLFDNPARPDVLRELKNTRGMSDKLYDALIDAGITSEILNDMHNRKHYNKVILKGELSVVTNEIEEEEVFEFRFYF